MLFYFLFLLSFKTNAQTQTVRDTFSVNVNNLYKISALSIIPFSEKIFLSNKLLNKNQYTISYEKGIFSLSENMQYSISDTIIIVYLCMKLNLKKEYKRRSLITISNTSGKNYDDEVSDSIKISKPLQSYFTSESIFGKNIQKSGAIIRGFTIGTNRDFTLNSGLKLQLSGKLSNNIDIVAALSDENTPIQPEGNTETLQELDKVFIEIRHKNAIGTFGDFDLVERESEFSQLTKKLQGLKGEFNYENTQGTFVIASSRGKFNTLRFYGQDGNQGPYRLYGINNEKAIIIIAGSERVYLDGELLKRGENNDYVIDYSNSEVTFTPKRLITSASRISIDFEYTDQNYRRNFFGTSLSTKILGDKLKFGVSYYREGDDEKSPIDLNLSDSDTELLRNAGDNRNAAVRSGVTIALPDSIGKVLGAYTKIDTTVNSQPYSYYLYSPGSAKAIYNVSFTFVGEGKGDYIKESLGNYKFVGIGQGSYLPIIFLPLPELKQIGNISIQTSPWKGVNFNFELSGSSWDKNRFSNINDDNNFGYARKILFDIEPQKINIGKNSLGKIGISLKERFIQSRYTTLDRINAVEFNRYYNLPDAQLGDQILREIGATFLPINQLSINTLYGFLKQGDDFNSNRLFSEIKLNEPQHYDFYYKLDFVKSKNELITTNWNRQNISGSYSFGLVRPGINFLYENKEEKIADSLLTSSLRYSEASPFIELSSPSFDIRLSYAMREESFPINNQLQKQSLAKTKQLQIGFKGLKEFTSTLNFTMREKNYTEHFKKLGFSDNETILLLSQSRFNLWQNFILGDFYYQAATEQTARLEKVFLKVSQGSGNYIYLGDLNSNGIADENEFQITSYDGDYILITIPTEKLFPVIDLKSYLRWSFDFEKIINGKDLFSLALKALSTETFWRIEENSKDKNTRDIYLLRFSKFLNDSTTLKGSQLFQQDFNLFKNSSDFSIRFRYLQRKSLNQYSFGTEKGYFKERSIRIRFRLVKEISNQTDFVNQVDNLISQTTSNRTRKVDRNDLSTDFSYRPLREIEVGFKILVGSSKDSYPLVPTIVDINSFMFRINYSITNFGRLRLEAERTELLTNSKTSNIPFEITRGNVVGKNYFWRVYFDYKIGSNIQTTLNYDARLLGNSRVIHTMRAEARAFF